MRAIVRRVSSARVTVDGGTPQREVARIGRGLLLFGGVERHDGPGDARYIARKVRDPRVFENPSALERRLDRSVAEIGGAVLVVSQFTLAGACRKGRRPSFDAVAEPETGKPLYEEVVRELRASGLSVATGEFQATMYMSLVNDGPVTLLLDSRKRL